MVIPHLGRKVTQFQPLLLEIPAYPPAYRGDQRQDLWFHVTSEISYSGMRFINKSYTYLIFGFKSAIMWEIVVHSGMLWDAGNAGVLYMEES